MVTMIISGVLLKTLLISVKNRKQIRKNKRIRKAGVNLSKEIKVKPLFVRIMCVHSYSGGVRVVYDKKGNKRHVKICYKCGHRKYID